MGQRNSVPASPLFQFQKESFLELIEMYKGTDHEENLVNRYSAWLAVPASPLVQFQKAAFLELIEMYKGTEQEEKLVNRYLAWLAGEVGELWHAFNIVKERGPARGLFLSEPKTECWWPCGDTVAVQTDDRWQFFRETDVHIGHDLSTKMLGSSIGALGANAIIETRVKEVAKIIAKSAMIEDPQLQLTLLRSCLGFPKINFVLRTLPLEWISDAIRLFDDSINEGLTAIWNSGFTPFQRHVIAAPIARGGVGIPIARQMALSAYTASSISSSELQSCIFSNPSMNTGDRFDRILCRWNRTNEQQVTMQDLLAAKTPQHLLSNLSHNSFRNSAMAQALPREISILNGMRSSSSLWLNITPMPHMQMSAPAYRMALKYKTGHQLYLNQKQCSNCTKNATSDVYGDHDAVCAGGGRLVRRHNQVRDIIFAAAVQAQLAPRKEAPNVIHSGERPADILIPRWQGDRAMCIDVSVVSPHVGQYNPNNTTTAADRAEKVKIDKYRGKCEDEGLVFEPFVLETTGLGNTRGPYYPKNRQGLVRSNEEGCTNSSTVASRGHIIHGTKSYGRGVGIPGGNHGGD